jgi:hypothetical protein
VYRFDLGPVCINNDPVVQTCLDGSNALDPLWIRTQNNGVWSDWNVLRWYTCVTDGPLIAAIEHEWSTLQPEPSAIDLQPGTGWVYATVPTIAMADDAPRVHTATLLGAAVEIVATPASYVWTWGDGATTSSTDPGSAYPKATISHTYGRGTDQATVGLSTTWTGRYRVNGGAWVDFDTTITSTSPGVPLQVVKPHSRLVDCDANGACLTSAAR